MSITACDVRDCDEQAAYTALVHIRDGARPGRPCMTAPKMLCTRCVDFYLSAQLPQPCSVCGKQLTQRRDLITNRRRLDWGQTTTEAEVVRGLVTVTKPPGKRGGRPPAPRNSPGPGPAPHPIPEHWAPTVAVFIAEQTAAKRSPETIRTRTHHLRKIARDHPEVGPLEITRAQLVDYMASNPWAPRTAHSTRATLRVFFALLHELGLRDDDPARTLPGVALPRSRPRPCPDHVVLESFAAVTDPKVRLAIRIAVETGMRRAEIANLKPADIEGRPGGYNVHIVGKGGHERAVPISDELAGLILAVTTVHVFSGLYGGAITPRHLGRMITRALPGDWTTHTLRHRFATMAYAAGNDLRAVQELLGHTSPVTTAIYTKVPDGSMRSAAAAAILGGEDDDLRSNI